MTDEKELLRQHYSYAWNAALSLVSAIITLALTVYVIEITHPYVISANSILILLGFVATFVSLYVCDRNAEAARRVINKRGAVRE